MTTTPTPTTAPKPSTVRMRRRTAIIDVLAVRMSKDGLIDGKKATWARLSTRFAQVLPESFTAADLENKAVTKKVVAILKEMIENASQHKDGKADDLISVLEAIPRKSRVKKVS